MDRTIVLSLFLGMISFSSIAAAKECPKPESIVATKEEESDGIKSMAYCSPSEQSCQWKGFDPMADKGSKVKELLNKDGVPTENNSLTYCDYKLETGDQIRMTLTQ